MLLPGRQVPEGAQTGDEVEVFLYKDSQDRLIATTAHPKLTMGSVARLTVKEVTKDRGFSGLGAGEGPFPAIPAADEEGSGRRRMPGGTLYRQKRKTVRYHECI